VDDKQLLDALRIIIREEASGAEQRINARLDAVENNLSKRIDTVEQAVLETSQNAKNIKDRLVTTETDVRLLKKLASQ
jgi:hypothetical protein